MNNHLDFYKKIDSIPTVNLNDLKKKILFDQRDNFYFNIGLTKENFVGKKILEFCPGTGYNAYYLIKKFKIKKIKLVDNNIASIKFLKKNLSKLKNVNITMKDLNKFKSNEKYDFVIMENAIDNFSNEKKVLKKVSSYVKKDGFIILTIGDKYGILSMKLRFIYSLILLEQKKIKDFNKKISFLTSVFNSHLKYLSKNTRKTKKWVLDNIINSDFIRKKNYLDYPNLINMLKENILIQNTSPQFNKNFIWYKNFKMDANNRLYLKNYFSERKNFLDFETSFEHDFNIERNLNSLYNYIYRLNPDKKLDIKVLQKIKSEVVTIIRKIKYKKKISHNKVILALEEFIKILENFNKKKIIKKNTRYFKKFWGIYNQNILLYKS